MRYYFGIFWQNNRRCLLQQFICLPPVLVPMGGEGLVEWGEVPMAMPSSAGIGARVSDVVTIIGGLYGARRGRVEASCLPKNLVGVPLGRN
jgi:hypothetical protein